MCTPGVMKYSVSPNPRKCAAVSTAGQMFAVTGESNVWHCSVKGQSNVWHRSHPQELPRQARCAQRPAAGALDCGRLGKPAAPAPGRGSRRPRGRRPPAAGGAVPDAPAPTAAGSPALRCCACRPSPCRLHGAVWPAAAGPSSPTAFHPWSGAVCSIITLSFIKSGTLLP
jgi:hypothetical protein